MNTPDLFSSFTRQYQLQKTLRFELKPVPLPGESSADALARLKDSPFFKKDMDRENAYDAVKQIIDDFFRDFIDKSLSEVAIDWTPLAQAIDNRDETTLKKAEGIFRKEITKTFGQTGDLLNKNLFVKHIPEWLENFSEEAKAEKLQKLLEFDKFYTYFYGFWENRGNMFSGQEQHTAIAFRIVNENFPKFYENIKAFNAAPEEVRTKLSQNFPDTNLSNNFSVNAFNQVLTQAGIDQYNTLIGGIPAESGQEKVQGFNELINEWRQRHPGEKPRKMNLLYKQILSDRNNSWADRLLQDDEDLVSLLKGLYSSLFETTEGKETAISEAEKLISDLPEFEVQKIWISGKNIPAIALALFGEWDALNPALEITGDEDATSGKDKLFSWQDVSESIKSTRETIDESSQNNVTKLTTLLEFFQKIKITEDKNLRFVSINEFALATEKKLTRAILHAEQAEKLIGNENITSEIKSALDDVMEIFHKIKSLNVPGKLLRNKEVDSTFYAEFEHIFAPFSSCARVYDSARNYLTKKPYSTEKMKLCFDCPTLASGWDENKIPDKHALILRKGGKYFLGILNSAASSRERKAIVDCIATHEEERSVECYERMVYKFLPDPVKMLPKVFLSSRKGIETFNPPSELIDKETRNNDIAKLVRFYQQAIPRYNNGDWNVFEFKFKKPESYQSANEFYKDVERQNYRIDFKSVPVSKINDFVSGKSLFLFEIYNKDFSDKSSGKKNLHSLFWLSAFSNENANADFQVKLNGEAEIFWRAASIPLSDTVVHPVGSILVNRRDTTGCPIPEHTYIEIYCYKNGKITEDKLSENAKTLLSQGKVIFKEASYNTLKDRRYTEDKFLFHVPLTFNRVVREDGADTYKKLNEKVRTTICGEESSVKIIGIDRGERNLISLALIDGNGKILLQKSFNEIEERSRNAVRKTNYQDLLKTRETERQDARKSWQTIGKIAELKEGYLSQVVHEISKLIVEHNAIVVLENLNVGFKRGRFGVERQVYQKFERALIEKLNFLVFKDREATAPGGVLNAYQLTNKFESFEKLGNQSGILFYVPAGYTSKIDPTTGFANIFDLSGFTNIKSKKAFFSKFTAIRYSSKDQAFEFEFDYKNFTTYKQKFHKTKWSVFSYGERLVWNGKLRKTDSVNPTRDILSALSALGIADAENGKDLVPAIKAASEDKTSAAAWDKLFRAFRYTLQMRNSIPNTEVDYLISPVKNKNGEFFSTQNRSQEDSLPFDADSNGAYHIALKGLMGIRSEFSRGWQKNDAWFKFVQAREFES